MQPTDDHLARRAFAALLALSLLVATATAGPFTDLVVFGDSLSDVGNIAQATFDIYPGPYYYSDRFSNGPVFVEALSVGLGLPSIARSTAGGDDFAYGGAKTSGTGGLEGLFIRDVDEQVDQFLATRIADPDALYLFFSGANDLVGGQTNVNIPVGNLIADMDRLITAGARQLLVLNLPPLGHTPRFNGNPTTRATYSNRTQQFNSVLDAMLDALQADHPAITVHRFDVAALFNQALADPAEFGFTNVTDAAAPGLTPGTSSYNTSQIAANPNEYVFWDDLHPTATVHAILAQRILNLLILPGDYNDDGVVDAADYVVWRRGLGTSFTMSDYDDWRSHFGKTSGMPNAAGVFTAGSTAVPEPATLSCCMTLTWLLGIIGVSNYRR